MLVRRFTFLYFRYEALRTAMAQEINQRQGAVQQQQQQQQHQLLFDQRQLVFQQRQLQQQVNIDQRIMNQLMGASA